MTTMVSTPLRSARVLASEVLPVPPGVPLKSLWVQPPSATAMAAPRNETCARNRNGCGMPASISAAPEGRRSGSLELPEHADHQRVGISEGRTDALVFTANRQSEWKSRLHAGAVGESRVNHLVAGGGHKIRTRSGGHAGLLNKVREIRRQPRGAGLAEHVDKRYGYRQVTHREQRGGGGMRIAP